MTGPDHSALNQLFVELGNKGCSIDACGSQITCRPPPSEEDSDHDYLIEHLSGTSGLAAIHAWLAENGFSRDGADHYDPGDGTLFTSWRREKINLIVTGDNEFAGRHHAATSVCKRLNLLKKADRIAVFKAVLYGEAS